MLFSFGSICCIEKDSFTMNLVSQKTCIAAKHEKTKQNRFFFFIIPPIYKAFVLDSFQKILFRQKLSLALPKTDQSQGGPSLRSSLCLNWLGVNSPAASAGGIPLCAAPPCLTPTPDTRRSTSPRFQPIHQCHPTKWPSSQPSTCISPFLEMQVKSPILKGDPVSLTNGISVGATWSSIRLLIPCNKIFHKFFIKNIVF